MSQDNHPFSPSPAEEVTFSFNSSTPNEPDPVNLLTVSTFLFLWRQHFGVTTTLLTKSRRYGIDVATTVKAASTETQMKRM